jgi:DNA-binding winged helix-turn-helix (wHTH) protein
VRCRQINPIDQPSITTLGRTGSTEGCAVSIRTGESVGLTPKAIDTLVALIERAGRVVEKDELFRAVWGDIVVGDDTLAQNVSTLRRVLGDDANRPRVIATVPRRGYRFVAAVSGAPAPTIGDAPEVSKTLPPEAATSARRPTCRLLALIGTTALIAVVAGFAAQRLSVKPEPRALVQFIVPEPENQRFPPSGACWRSRPTASTCHLWPST